MTSGSDSKVPFCINCAHHSHTPYLDTEQPRNNHRCDAVYDVVTGEQLKDPAAMCAATRANADMTASCFCRC